jgi:4-amino-4-deoxy-L-arabinose transferase-like glycosyltransferase
MNSPWRYAISCAVLAAIVFFFNLGGPKLWDRDEPRNAGCAREMLERHDWVTPYFNGELRDHKPVLLYWFMMSAYAVFGINEFSARFWSAVLGVGTVLMTFDLGRRWFGPRAGFWAGMMLSTCMMFPVAARAATPDSVLIFFATAALWLYAGSWLEKESYNPLRGDQVAGSPRRWQVVAAYAAMGMAVLAKGPIGFVLPAGIIFLFHLWQVSRDSTLADDSGRKGLREITRLVHPATIWVVVRRMNLALGIGVVLLVALPWYLWVGIRTDGVWLRGFFLTHNVNRFLEPMEGHRGPIFFYPLAFFACFFPWSFLTIPAIPSIVRSLRSKSEGSSQLGFLTIWILAYMGFFSLAGTKLPSYITPCLPAFAVMLGWWLDRWVTGLETAPRGVLTGIMAVYLLLGGILLVALPIAARIFLPGEEILGGLGLIWIGGSVAAILALRRGQRMGYACAMATTAFVFAVTAFGAAAVRVSHHQRIDQVMALLRGTNPQPRVASYDCLEPSWVYYLGHPIRFIPASEVDQLVSFLRETQYSCVLTTRDRYEQISHQVPTDVGLIAEIPYFLRDKQIVLLGSKELLAAIKPGQLQTLSERPPRVAERSQGNSWR